MVSLTTNSMRLMEHSLDYLWAKQAAHLDNLSNAETPGYKVKTVSFEERLDAKLRRVRRQVGFKTSDYRTAIEETGWKVTEDEETTRMDENGVNIIEQSVEAVRTGFQAQYIMQLISRDFQRITSALGAQ